jgi:LmbE family N-acetylglucosaminyl deacetylase
MAVRRLLISYAHPDDESFGLGGLITRYVEQGVEVYLICATNGDVGTVAPEMLNGYNSVAELRLAELDCAAETLGLSQVYKLGFKDSGMMGSETSNDPACLWQAPQEVVTRRVVEVLREVQPQVVITFNKFGGYGHPDHIAIQRATAEAFKLASDPAYVTDGYTPYQPQKLYYSNPSRRQVLFGITLLRLRGQDPRRLGKNKDIDLQAILDYIEPTHTRINIRDFLAAWDRASQCHKSQLGGGFVRFPMWLRKTLGAHQGFTRIYPVPAANRIDEHDLFTGVTPHEREHPQDKVVTAGAR